MACPVGKGELVRKLVFIFGAPGTGKTTLREALVARLRARGVSVAEVDDLPWVLEYLQELGIPIPAGNGKHGEFNATGAAVDEATRLGLDLEQVKGSGPGGRIYKWDVTGAAARG